MNKYYCVFFRLSDEVKQLVLEGKNVKLPSLDYHTTLAFFEMKESNEKELIQELEKIEFSPINISTKEFAEFDNDSYVILTTKPQSLLSLHENIINTVLPYLTSEQQEFATRYAKKKYNPHTTVGKNSNPPMFSNNILGQSMRIDTYHLFKTSINEDKEWQKVASFNSSE